MTRIRPLAADLALARTAIADAIASLAAHRYAVADVQLREYWRLTGSDAEIEQRRLEALSTNPTTPTNES